MLIDFPRDHVYYTNVLSSNAGKNIFVTIKQAPKFFNVYTNAIRVKVLTYSLPKFSKRT